MRIVDTFPREVREIENAWIPLPDGSRLAARVWLPADAEARPVPAILEYLPYRKRDGTRERDEPIHRYFAGHGYAAVRVDVRGSGDSDGLLTDEYSEEEIDDALAVVDWLATRPWSTGAVGMMGKSWGGINALQVAALQPPALQAILTVCSTDDRYTDDAHYMGGCPLNEGLLWGSALFTLAAQPPDPELVGEGWREMWRQRLDGLPLYLAAWLAHPHRDGYWRRGSVSEDLGRIRCPVYAVGGWADAYTNAVPRLLAGLRAPSKGLVGPWAHLYPHEGVPGPAIGFLQEALRWWDRWLKGIENGIEDEPRYRVWMPEGEPPDGEEDDDRPGRWVAEPTWPSPRIRNDAWRLAPGRLVEEEGEEAGQGGETAGARWLAEGGGVGNWSDDGEAGRLDHRSPQTVGLAGGAWCSFGEGDGPGEQRDDDAHSLVFDSPPLAERLEILGAPEVVLDLAVDRPRAFVAVRLDDVAPPAEGGGSARVTYGLLDLALRHDLGRPEPPVPGRRMTVRLRLNQTAHAFPAGHRLRLAISTTYWPIAWPSPEPVTLSLWTGGEARLELPVRPTDLADADLRPFGPPEGAPGPATTELDPGGIQRRVERDPATGETTVTLSIDALDDGSPAVTRFDDLGLETGHALVERYRVRDDDPLSAETEIVHRSLRRRADWSVRIETRTRLTATADFFRLEAELQAYEGEARVFAKSWDERVPRSVDPIEPPDQ